MCNDKQNGELFALLKPTTNQRRQETSEKYERKNFIRLKNTAAQQKIRKNSKATTTTKQLRKKRLNTKKPKRSNKKT